MKTDRLLRAYPHHKPGLTRNRGSKLKGGR